jgi:creatinine amidohydrolase
MNKKNIYWAQFRSTQLKEYIDDSTVAVVMVGSCEQHGFHLPLDTDTSVGYKLIEKAALMAKEKVLILPPIWAGYSPHHMDFCGSITLSQETLHHLIQDICISISAHKVKRILLVNGHGGNSNILRTAVDELGVKQCIYPILITYFSFFAEPIQKVQRSAKGGMGHAGELETSLQLYLSPELVDTDKLEGEIVKGNDYFQPGMFINNRVYQYRSFFNYSNIGVIGEPRSALKETGEKLFKVMVQGLADFFDDIAKGLVV